MGELPVTGAQSQKKTLAITESPQPEYAWKERHFWVEAAPAGTCWSMREPFSYSTGLPRFLEHVEAMAEGLDRAYVTFYDHRGDYPDDSCDWFVVGLRPLTPEDRTEAERRAEYEEQIEREQLAHLKEKYPDA